MYKQTIELSGKKNKSVVAPSDLVTHFFNHIVTYPTPSNLNYL